MAGQQLTTPYVLPPREIAARTGVPVDTARTRVRRGLERLRADLDGPRGPGREALLGALAPWFDGPEGAVLAASTGVTWMGGIAMNKLLAASLLVIAAAAGWWWLRDPVAPAVARGPEQVAEVVPDLPEVEAPRAEPVPAVATEASARTPLPSAPTYEVEGVIALDVETPLPHGHVRLQVLAGSGLAGEVLFEQRLEADEGGVFRARVELADTPRTLVLQEDEPEHYGHRTWITAVAGDEPWGPWMVPAFPLDVVVDGRVVDAQGAGIADARVVQQVYEADREVATDAEGRFRMRLSSRNESTRLVVRASGYGEALAIVARREPGSSLTLVPIVLDPEARLYGRVVDAQGRPVEGARVRNRRQRLAEWCATDADGRFELGALAPDGPTAWLEVRHPEYAWLEHDAKSGDEPLELTLERGHCVRGRVIDASGASVFGAWVRLGSSYSAGIEPPTLTNAEGRFELSQRVSDVAHVWVWASEFASTHVVVSAPTVGADTAEVEITLEPERVLRGRVLLPDGEPRPWAMVYVEDLQGLRRPPRFDDLQVFCDAQGRFAVHGLPGGAVRAGATVSGYRRVEVELPEVTTDELELRLAPATGLAGRVVDGASGAPVTEFTLRVRHAPGLDGRMSSSGGISTTWTDHGVAFSDAEGRWSVSGLELPPEAYLAVEVEAPGYAPGRLASVPVALDPAPESCVVELSRGTLVVGRVVDSEQRPVAGARVIPATDERDVAIAVERPERRAHVLTDAGGRFELPALPTGTARLLVLADGHPPTVDGPFEVLGDTTVRRDIELSYGARVHGRLLDAQGLPLVGEDVSLYALEGVGRTIEHACTTDERGAYKFKGVSTGTFHLRWRREHGGRVMFDRQRLLVIEEDADVELDLVPAGTASAHGRVQFVGDVPPVAVLMILPAPEPGARPDARGTMYARAAWGAFVVDGEFQVDGLPAGQLTFLVSHDAGDSSSQMGSTRLELAEGEHVEVLVELKEFGLGR